MKSSALILLDHLGLTNWVNIVFATEILFFFCFGSHDCGQENQFLGIADAISGARERAVRSSCPRFDAAKYDNVPSSLRDYC